MEQQQGEKWHPGRMQHGASGTLVGVPYMAADCLGIGPITARVAGGTENLVLLVRIILKLQFLGLAASGVL